MTRRNIAILAAVVAGLVLMLLALESGDDQDSQSAGRPLLPGFKARANDVTGIDVTRGSESGAGKIAIRREGDRWIVSSRDGYPADTGKLRQLIVSLAEASVVEEKTSNPELYARLAVDDPEDGGGGTRIDLEGAGFDYAVVLGTRAQGAYQYARIPGQPASYLIDRAAEIPDAGDWLMPDILNVAADRIKSISIKHADGESLDIGKASAELTDFSVRNVPDGRELSYATVGNGIAGALATLTLDDVRPSPASDSNIDAVTTTVFETWDGLSLSAMLFAEDEITWVSFSAQANPADPAPGSPESDPAGPSVDTPDAMPVEEPSVEHESAALNERLAGWQYRIPDHKKNLLSRRWEDILKAADQD